MNFTKKDLNQNIYNRKKLLLNLGEHNLYNNDQFELLSNYDDFINYIDELNINNKDIFKCIYYNKRNIHNILYNSDEIIDIDSFPINSNLSTIFYLSLLIEDQRGIINYSYKLNFIKKLNKEIQQKIVNSKTFRDIILSKIMLVFINNYRGLENYDEEKDQEILTKIEKHNTDRIINNLQILGELHSSLNISDIKERKVDEIYIEIIISLIREGKFEDYEYIYNIIEQLDLEKINLTSIMYDKLIIFLNTNKNNHIQYAITQKEELLKEKNINFYYILIKFIIKNSIYIYQISIFLELKKFVVSLIKENDILYNNLDNDSRNKLKYIIDALLDSKYYENNVKIPKIDLLKLKEILNCYKEYYFESKEKDIEILENIIKYNKGEYKEYLKENEFAKKMNERFPIIIYFISSYNLSKENISEKEILEIEKKWEFLEKSINDKKVKNLRKNDKLLLYNYFSNENNKKILLTIFHNENKIQYFIEEYKKNFSKYQGKEINQDNKIPELIINNLGTKMSDIKEENKIKEDENNNNRNKDKDNTHTNSNTVSNISIANEMTTILQTDKTKVNFVINNQTIDNKIDNSLPPLPIDNYNIDDFILDKILTKSIFKFHMNENKSIIIDEIYFGDNGTKISIEQFELNFGYFQDKKNLKKINHKNAQKFYEFIKEFRYRLITEYKNSFLLKTHLYFQKEIESNSDDIFNISCKYIFFEPINNKSLCFLDRNILINKTNSNTLGFEFLITEINKAGYKDIKYNQNNLYIYNNIPNQGVSKKLINEIKDITLYNNISGINKVADKEKIIDIIKIIENNNKYNGFIKELNNGNYITLKSDYSINLYDIYFNKIMNIPNFKEPIFDLNEKIINNESYEDNKIIYLTTCMNNNMYSITIDLNQLNSIINVKNLPGKDNSFLNCLEINSFNSIALGLNGVYNLKYKINNYTDLFNELSNIKINLLFKETYFNSIKINDNILGLVSNSILPGGKDELLIYNLKSKKSIFISDYSFIISPNGLTLIEKNIETDDLIQKYSEDLGKKHKKRKKNKRKTKNENYKNQKILLCACKKYSKNQNNGILIINFESNDITNAKNNFIDLDTFEVNCFCPISIIENENLIPNNDYDIINDEYKNKINIIETNYFLVGGFDTSKRQGIIKLYKLIFYEDLLQFDIEYIQDIEFLDDDKYDIYNSSVNCIIQSKISGNIIISCYNGKIFLCTPPNIDYYLDMNKNNNDNRTKGVTLLN